MAGSDRASLDNGWNFHAGGGFAVTGEPSSGHNWSAFITANFMFDQLAIQGSAIKAAQVMNPQDPGLLNATGGHAKVYLATLDPTFRFPVGKGNVYVFGGFGWMRRSLSITGPSGQGALLEPTSPTVFGGGGNSGAFDAGAGMNFRLAERLGALTPYVEVRVVHGFAINSATTLIPLSAGIRW